MKTPVYRVVELSVVTDESIEIVLNRETALGWHFEGLQFAMRESSKRPSMAFVLFTQAPDGSRDESVLKLGVDAKH